MRFNQIRVSASPEDNDALRALTSEFPHLGQPTIIRALLRIGLAIVRKDKTALLKALGSSPEAV